MKIIIQLMLRKKGIKLHLNYRYSRKINTFSTHSLQPNKNIRVRFAPSPTGDLHLGGLRTALYNYLFARSNGGSFILRIEDTDQNRLVSGSADRLIEILKWVDIEIDEGPGFGGDYGPYIQSERSDIYTEHVESLLQNGNAYHCFCTQKRLEILRKDCIKRGQRPGYDNKCRNLSKNEVFKRKKNKEQSVIRFKLPDKLKPWNDLLFGTIQHDIIHEGDPIIIKADSFPTYHFANVVDDKLMKISHVLRGIEWQISTPKHIALFNAFEWSPPKYGHLPLILNSDGLKLSKRQNAATVGYFKDRGYFPETVISLLATAGGGFVNNSEEFSIYQMISNFKLDLINKKSSRLPMDRLDQIQHQHFKKKLHLVKTRKNILNELKMLINKHFERLDLNSMKVNITDEYLNHVLEWSQNRIIKINDLVSSELLFLWSIPKEIETDIPPKKVILILEDTIQSVCNLAKLKNIDKNDIINCLKEISKRSNIKYAQFMKLLRMSLSGLKEGPSLAEIIEVLGIEQSVSRLQNALRLIDNINIPKNSLTNISSTINSPCSEINKMNETYFIAGVNQNNDAFDQTPKLSIYKDQIILNINEDTASKVFKYMDDDAVYQFKTNNSFYKSIYNQQIIDYIFYKDNKYSSKFSDDSDKNYPQNDQFLEEFIKNEKAIECLIKNDKNMNVAIPKYILNMHSKNEAQETKENHELYSPIIIDNSYYEKFPKFNQTGFNFFDNKKTLFFSIFEYLFNVLRRYKKNFK